MNNYATTTDLTDSPADQERLQGDVATMEMPDVKDIPGQEHVNPLPMREMYDTTISSDDEEGAGILNDLNGPGDDDDEDEIEEDGEDIVETDEVPDELNGDEPEPDGEETFDLDEDDDETHLADDEDDRNPEDEEDKMSTEEYANDDAVTIKDPDAKEYFEADETLNEDEDVINSANDADVSLAERKILADAADTIQSEDEAARISAMPDSLDEDGEPLNERSSVSGADLDIPGDELDDADEEIGEEDEENNVYSVAQK